MRMMKPHEWKVVSVRECPESMMLCQTPQMAVDYWNANVVTAPHFNPDVENFVVLMLNTKNRIKGHQIVSVGTLNASLVHPREVFRAAIATASASIVLAHCHPSGDPSPSTDDIKITKELVAAGKLLKIEILDHLIVGYKRHSSLQEMGLM